MTQYWGGTRHFFLLIICNFKNLGGGGWGGARAPPSPPCSAVPVLSLALMLKSESLVEVKQYHNL